jgi:hypothetical protein
MTLPEIEMKSCEKLVAAFIEQRRPPPHLRAKLDLAFRIANQSVELFELRPHYLDNDRVLEHPIAKATYNKRKKIWKVFWQRADMRWHGYQPHPEAASIEEFLEVVRLDTHCCFFG